MKKILSEINSHWKNILVVSVSTVAFVLVFFAQHQITSPQNIEKKRYRLNPYLQKGHLSEIKSIEFSPNGKIFATSGGGEVKLWDIKTGRELHTLVKGSYIPKMAFSPDGETLFGAENNRYVFWNVKSGEIVRSIPKKETAQFTDAVAISYIAGVIVQSELDGNTRVLDIRSGNEIALLKGHKTSIFRLVFSSDGKVFASGDMSGVVKLWRTNNWQEINSYSNDRSIGELIFSPDGKLLIIGSYYYGNGERSEFRQLVNGNQKDLPEFQNAHSIQFNYNGQYLIGLSLTEYSKLIMWNKDLSIVQKFEQESQFITAFAIGYDGRTLAAGNREGGIKLWDIITGRELYTIEKKTSQVESVEFDDDGKRLFFVQRDLRKNNEYNFKLFDMANGNKLHNLNKILVENQIDIGGGWDIKISPDGEMIVISGSRRFERIIVLANTNGDTLWKINKPMIDVDSIAISPGGKFLAMSNDNGSIELWDIRQNKLVNKFVGHTKFVWNIAFSSDGKTLTSAGEDETIRLWEVESGRQLKISEKQSNNISSRIVFSSDGRTAAIEENGIHFEIWDIIRNKKIQEFNEIGYVFSFNLIKEGKYLITWSGDTIIRVWSVETGKEIGQLIFLNESDWVVMTPEGLFDGSAGGLKLIHFVIENEIIELEQLKSRYYTPNLWRKILNEETLPQIGEFAVTLYPAIEIQWTKVRPSRLNLKLKNRGGGIGRVEVRVNGSEVISDMRVGKNINPKIATVNLPVDIPITRLRKGSNKIEIIAWNSEGDVRSQSNEFFLDFSEDGIISKGIEIINLKPQKSASEINFYAIFSGISDYAGSEMNLRYAAKDAEDIAKSISLAARKYFCNEELLNKKPCERVHLKILSTEKEKHLQFSGLPDVPDLKRLKPTKSNLKEAFAEVAKNAKAEDVVLVYFSGHGTTITSGEAVKESAFPDMYLYATQDAVTLDRAAVINEIERENKMVSSLELAKWVFEIKADKKVMILDTCAAGAAQKSLASMTKAVDALQIRSIDRLRERTGFYILMGSASDAVSYEANQYRQGLLTYSLIEAMTTDKNLRDGKFLDIENWFVFAEDRVEDLAKDIGGIQRPSFFKSNFAKTFDIGRIESDEQKQIPLARRVPLILQPELREKSKFTDKERLTDKLEIQLIEQSRISNRGNYSAISYIKATYAVNGISPRGFYTLNSDGTISMEVSLIKDEEEIKKIKISGNRENIVEILLQEILKASISM